MITGIGLDIVELDRIGRLDRRSAKFRERILTQAELQEYSRLSKGRQIEYLAGRFAAKEAFAKARGTGIGGACSFREIEVLRSENGRPCIFFRGREHGFVSITHTKEMAAAQVVLQS